MLVTNHAKYIGSFVNYQQLQPHPGCEIALLGRSNVGKSTFINILTQRKKLAYTSQTPGKTRTLNQYYINDDLTIIDVPGYGYAKVSFTQRNDFIKMIDSFLKKAHALKLIILLIDYKIGPTKDDLEMIEFLKTLDCEFVVLCTKLDKIPKTKRHNHKTQLIEKLQLDPRKIYFYTATNPATLTPVVDCIEDKISVC